MLFLCSCCAKDTEARSLTRKICIFFIGLVRAWAERPARYIDAAAPNSHDSSLQHWSIESSPRAGEGRLGRPRRPVVIRRATKEKPPAECPPGVAISGPKGRAGFDWSVAAVEIALGAEHDRE